MVSRPKVVAFDVVGATFALEPVRERLPVMRLRADPSPARLTASCHPLVPRMQSTPLPGELSGTDAAPAWVPVFAGPQAHGGASGTCTGSEFSLPRP